VAGAPVVRLTPRQRHLQADALPAPVGRHTGRGLLGPHGCVQGDRGHRLRALSLALECLQLAEQHHQVRRRRPLPIEARQRPAQVPRPGGERLSWGRAGGEHVFECSVNPLQRNGSSAVLTLSRRLSTGERDGHNRR
jgi:hypothetical protein